jgi:uncharacterized membrane protein YgcG
MAYNNQEKDKRPKAPFDLFQLTLWAPSTAPGKSAMFLVDVGIDGKVSFTVRTGDPADKEKAKDGDVIRMRMSLLDYEKFVNLFGDVLRAKGPIKRAAVEQVYYKFNKDTKQRERMDTPRDGNKLFINKDADGTVSISLVQYNRTNIEFGFLPRNPEILFANEDGQKWSDGEMSLSNARAYQKILAELFTRVMASTTRQHQVPDLYQPPYVPPAQGSGSGGGYGNKSGGGGNSYGNNQNRNNGGGGGNSNGGGNRAPIQAEDDMEDDIPY